MSNSEASVIVADARVEALEKRIHELETLFSSHQNGLKGLKASRKRVSSEISSKEEQRQKVHPGHQYYKGMKRHEIAAKVSEAEKFLLNFCAEYVKSLGQGVNKPTRATTFAALLGQGPFQDYSEARLKIFLNQRKFKDQFDIKVKTAKPKKVVMISPASESGQKDHDDQKDEDQDHDDEEATLDDN